MMKALVVGSCVFLALLAIVRGLLPGAAPLQELCPDGEVYDTDMRMCVDCNICDDFPETSICDQCGTNWGKYQPTPFILPIRSAFWANFWCQKMVTYLKNNYGFFCGPTFETNFWPRKRDQVHSQIYGTF